MASPSALAQDWSLPSDMAVATNAAEFAFPDVKSGLVPAVVSPYVVAVVGPRAARGLFASGRVFDAAHAQKIGLVDEIAAGAAALEAAQARLASEIMACAPQAVAEAKRLVADTWSKPVDHALMHETARYAAHARSGDEGREGSAAFLAKRKPSWAAV